MWLTSFLEAVQDVNRFLEFSDVHRPENSLLIPHTNLARSRPDVVERLPVGGIEPCLHLAELKASFLARKLRKRQQICIGRAHPADFLVGWRRWHLYKSLYVTRRPINVSFCQLVEAS